MSAAKARLKIKTVREFGRMTKEKAKLNVKFCHYGGML